MTHHKNLSSSTLPAILACLVTLLLAVPLHAAHAGAGLDANTRDLYGAILEDHTRATKDIVQTRVNYRAIQNDPRWKQVVAGLGESNPKMLREDDEKLAFWINAYNILAIDLVQNAYPVDSIKDLGSFFSPVWKAKAGTIGGRSYTLEEIEHKILRPMGEPRIHAAIVCASVSCPPLARTPFTPERINAQLDSIVRAWLSNPEKGLRLDRDDETLNVSKIFRWFESDFEAGGGVIQFVLPHMATEDADWLREHRADLDLEYFDYAWGLNE